MEGEFEHWTVLHIISNNLIIIVQVYYVIITFNTLACTIINPDSHRYM